MGVTTEYDTTPVVDAIGAMSFSGNVIHRAWLMRPELRRDDKKLNVVALMLLADCVYWYRPTKIVDEVTHQIAKVHKRFTADMWHIDYGRWGEAFGFTERQVRDAASFLVQRGLVRREVRNAPVELNNGRKSILPSRVYLEPIPEAIRRLHEPLHRDDTRLTLKREGGHSRLNVRGADVQTREAPTFKREHTKDYGTRESETKEIIPAPSQSSVTGAPQGRKRVLRPGAREFLASRGIGVAPKEKEEPVQEPEGDDDIWNQVAAELSEAPVAPEVNPPVLPEAPVGPIGQTRKTEKPKKPRQPDAMHDALAQHAGITGSENGSVKNLLAEKGVAAEEVESAVHFMQTRCFVTPQASAIKLGSWKKHLPAYLSWRDSDHSAQDGIEAALGDVIYGGEIPTSAIYDIAKEAALMARDGLTGQDILAGVKALRAADHFKFRAGTTLDAKTIRQEVPKWKAQLGKKAAADSGNARADRLYAERKAAPTQDPETLERIQQLQKAQRERQAQFQKR